MNIEKMLTFLGTYTEAWGTFPGDESRIKVRRREEAVENKIDLHLEYFARTR